MLPRRSTSGADHLVGLDSFLCGCSSIDKLHFGDTMGLLDQDRRVGPLEMLFMPRYIRTLIHEADKPKPHTLRDQEALAAALPISFKKDLFEEAVTDQKHETQGAKALRKILDLERRTMELESAVEADQIGDEASLENILRDILFPQEDTETLEVTQAGSVHGHKDRPSGSDQKLKDLVASQRQVEEATQRARDDMLEHTQILMQNMQLELAGVVRSSRGDVMEEVEAFIKEARSMILGDVERAMRQLHATAGDGKDDPQPELLSPRLRGGLLSTAFSRRTSAANNHRAQAADNGENWFGLRGP